MGPGHARRAQALGAVGLLVWAFLVKALDVLGVGVVGEQQRFVLDLICFDGSLIVFRVEGRLAAAASS